MTVERTGLPGVGVLHVLTTREGTGVSVLAVLRGEEITAAPGPEFIVRAGAIAGDIRWAGDPGRALGHQDGLARLPHPLAAAC